MSPPIRRLLAIALLGTSASAGADPTRVDEASPYALQIPGDFHGGEAVARDGKLDLIFDTSDHHNLQRPTLFLSRPADPAATALPLRAVAVYASAGC